MLSLIFWVGAVVCANADLISFRNAHPLGWMHLQPVGESPGWSKSRWLNIEIGQSNIFNLDFEMTDIRNNNTYSYKADFEQTQVVVDAGMQLSPHWAFGVEVPYANHSPGFLDDFIDQFHVFIRTTRFMRDVNPAYGNDFEIQTNGVDRIQSNQVSGIGNVKLKLKWWPLQWRSRTKGVCDCGLAFSTQVKLPSANRLRGLTSGRPDYAGLVHLGAPLGQFSGMWATGAVTKFTPNPILEGWPTRNWQQMYELTVELGVNANFGIFIQGRAESPLLEARYLKFNSTYPDNDPGGQKAERIASGWNALVQWRGSQSLGARWRWGEGSRVDFVFVEDFGLTDQDQLGAWGYVNNSPDVSFMTKWHFLF